MDETSNAIKNEDQTVATDQTVKSTTATEEVDDIESKLAQLEAEKNKAIEEAANYRLAFLKEKNKKQEDYSFQDESEEEKIARLVKEEVAKQKIAQLESEKEQLLQKVIKENKELKLSNLNKTNVPPAIVGGHSEGTPVRSTTITPEQASAFKARGWSDKDIERYKQNLKRFL